MNSKFKKDYYRMTGEEWDFLKGGALQMLCGHRLRYMYHFRKAQSATNYPAFLYRRIKMFMLSRKYGLEIHLYAQIGEGFAIFHPYNITINPDAIIGKNCNISKGVTIGMDMRGKRRGAPTIGDKVYTGINSTIVGKVKIGNDVLIAPNTFVNCDVPSHSIILGNPCKIIHRDNATEDFINFKV